MATHMSFKFCARPKLAYSISRDSCGIKHEGLQKINEKLATLINHKNRYYNRFQVMKEFLSYTKFSLVSKFCYKSYRNDHFALCIPSNKYHLRSFILVELILENNYHVRKI